VCLLQTIEELERCVEGGRSPEIPAVARALGDTPSTEARVRASANGRRGTLKAIMPVHFAGHPCDMDAIASAAREHQLSVIEDAAHACSASFRGRRIGSDMIHDVPSAVCFSFYATKTLATGEGGMVVTDRENWAERIRRMSLHGISKDAWKRYTAEGTWRYEITDAGYKYNMADIIAALGLAQLQKVDAMRERREAIALRYNEAFRQYSELETPTVRPGIGHAWHLYPLRFNGDESRGAWRDDFVEELRKRNISSSVHFIPLHLHPYYVAGFGYQPEDLPVAFREYRRELSLPIYSRMTDYDVESVIDAVVDIIVQARTKRSYALARC
jgi:dTDP-4-amino-4,6-dideoxygalactose transaminase